MPAKVARSMLMVSAMRMKRKIALDFVGTRMTALVSGFRAAGRAAVEGGSGGGVA